MNQLVDYSDSENEQDEKKTQNNKSNKLDLKQNNMQNKPKLIEPDEFFAKFSKKVIENQIKDTNTHNSGFLNKVAQQMQVKNFKEIKRPKTKEEAEYEQEQIVNETIYKIIEKEDEKLDDAPYVNIIKNQNTQKTLNYKRLNPLNLLGDDIEEIMAKKKQKTNIYIEQDEKKRKVPHLNGQYAGYIYIDISNFSHLFYNLATKINEWIQNKQIKVQPTDLTEQLDNLHVSLSKTFYIFRTDLQRYEDFVIKKLKIFHKFNLAFKIQNVKIYESENQRKFLAIDILYGVTNINDIVNAVDDIQEQFGQEKYYNLRKFHVSFMYSDDNLQKLKEFVEELNVLIKKSMSDEIYQIEINKLYLKLGQKITKIDLKIFN